MKRSVLGCLVAASLLFGQGSFAAAMSDLEAGLLSDVKQAKETAELLLACSNGSASSEQCKFILDLQSVLQKNEQLVNEVKPIFEKAVDSVHQAVVKDEAKIKQIEDIVYYKKSAPFHFQQIIAFAKSQLSSVQSPLKRFIAVPIEIERSNNSVAALVKSLAGKDLKEALEIIGQKESKNTLALNVEKWTNLNNLLLASLNQPTAEGESSLIALILKHASEGSVVYKIPAASPKFAGMLPFFCDYENGIYCQNEIPSVRFDVELLKNVLGENGSGQIVQILVRKKTWGEDLILLEALRGVFSRSDVDLTKKIITINYTETTSCNTSSSLDQAFGALLCSSNKVAKSRNLPSKKSIEEKLFEVLGVTDSSLKLYASEP